MSDLRGFSQSRKPRESREEGGRANEVPMATPDQLRYLDDLREKNGAPPLTRAEAARLTKQAAGDDIKTWKAMVPPPVLDKCPDNWDADTWKLTLLFEQRAQEAKIELAASRNFIYAEIDDLVTRHGIRKQIFHHEVHGCTRREMPYFLAARCWYHYPPFDLTGHEACEVNWVQMVEIIIAEFWSRIQNEHALDHFRQYFAEYGQAAVKHWNSLRVLRDIAETPKVEPAPRRRRAQGATMADASKEG